MIQPIANISHNANIRFFVQVRAVWPSFRMKKLIVCLHSLPEPLSYDLINFSRDRVLLQVTIIVVLYVNSLSEKYDLSGQHVPVVTRTCTNKRFNTVLAFFFHLR